MGQGNSRMEMWKGESTMQNNCRASALMSSRYYFPVNIYGVKWQMGEQVPDSAIVVKLRIIEPGRSRENSNSLICYVCSPKSRQWAVTAKRRFFIFTETEGEKCWNHFKLNRHNNTVSISVSMSCPINNSCSAHLLNTTFIFCQIAKQNQQRFYCFHRTSTV